jgi:hypothetical protein
VLRESAAACNPTSNACINLAGPVSTSFDVASTPSDLTAFINGDVDLDLAFTHQLAGILIVNGRPLPTITAASSFNWSGTAQVVYDYTPVLAATVPEPRSWALLICGLGGIGVLQRRRRTLA